MLVCSEKDNLLYKMLVSNRKTCQDKSMCIFRTELCIFAGYAGMQRDIVLVLVAVANWTAGWTLVPAKEASPMMLVVMMVMIVIAIVMFLMIRETMRLVVLKIIANLTFINFCLFGDTSFNSRPPNMEVKLTWQSFKALLKAMWALQGIFVLGFQRNPRRENFSCFCP